MSSRDDAPGAAHLRHRADANAQAGPGSEAVDRMVAVEQLFDRSYLRRPVSPAQWAALIAYAPLGVILALLRVILTVLLCAYAVTTKAVVPAITPTDKTLFGWICFIAGVRVRKVYGNVPRGNELDHSFIVSNHTFTGDPGLLYFMLKDNARVVHNKNVGSFDIITRHKIHVGDDKAEVRETIVNSIKSDPTPIVIYPEGATTNGSVGILRYAAFIFGLDRPVYPVGLRYYPAFSFIPLHTLKRNYSFNMFIVGFQPWINVDAYILPRQTRQQDELPEHFAQRVQRATAHAIGLVPTQYTHADKARLRKVLGAVPGQPPKLSHSRAASTVVADDLPSSPGTPVPSMTPSASAFNLMDASSATLISDSTAVLSSK